MISRAFYFSQSHLDPYVLYLAYISLENFNAIFDIENPNNNDEVTMLKFLVSVLIVFISQVSFAIDIPKGFTKEMVQIPGVKLNVYKGGSGKPLVLLHGYGESALMWHDAMEKFAKNYTVIAPDLRGGGLSEVTKDGYTKVQMAKDIKALLDHYNISKAYIVGHDIGLMVAYAFAAQYPDATEKLVLMDAFIPGVEPADAIYNDPNIWHFRVYGPFAEKLLAAYPAGADSVPKTARDLMRDAAFGWQTWAWATLQAKAGKSKVFYYYFDQHAPKPAGTPESDHGMPHGVDVPYVFQTLDRNDARLTAGDWAISDTVSTYWTNFAKHGDPNGPGVPTWPRYTDTDRRVMYFHDEAKPGPVPSADALAVLDTYFAWRRTPEGEAWAK